MSATTQQPGPTGPEADEHIEHGHLTEIAPGSHDGGRVLMLALDASPNAENAFEWAIKNLIRPDADDLVVLTTVREPVLVPGTYGMSLSLR